MKIGEVVISREALAVLKKMIAGQVLCGERYFPYPFMYHTIGIDGKAPATVPALVVSRLVKARLISALTTSLMQDVIAYRVTEAGKALVQDGPPPDDNSQLDWVGV